MVNILPIIVGTIFLFLILSLPKPTLATTYSGTDSSSSPASMNCDPGTGICTCTASTVYFPDFTPCTNQGVSPNNVCCTSGSCSTSDSNHPTIGLWDWDYAVQCYATTTTFPNCIPRLSYDYQRCGAYDSCNADYPQVVVITLGDEPLIGQGIIKHFSITLDHGKKVIVEK